MKKENKNSFVFYLDWIDHLSLLEPSEVMPVLNAIKTYIDSGKIDTLTGSAAMAFSFIKAQIDRDTERWDEVKKKRAEAGRAGAAATNNKRQKSAKPANDEFAEQGAANSAVTVTVPVNVPVTVPVPSKEGGDNKADKPPAPVRKKYGQYGWVRLSDKEYDRLLNDLGQAEVERCIAYIDESAQSTSNKNKWRDWNLVIRRCHRDGWGLGTAAGKSSQKVMSYATHQRGIRQPGAPNGTKEWTKGFKPADDAE